MIKVNNKGVRHLASHFYAVVYSEGFRKIHVGLVLCRNLQLIRPIFALYALYIIFLNYV